MGGIGEWEKAENKKKSPIYIPTSVAYFEVVWSIAKNPKSHFTLYI